MEGNFEGDDYPVTKLYLGSGREGGIRGAAPGVREFVILSAAKNLNKGFCKKRGSSLLCAPFRMIDEGFSQRFQL
jgi:hypothetical protein